MLTKENMWTSDFDSLNLNFSNLVFQNQGGILDNYLPLETQQTFSGTNVQLKKLIDRSYLIKRDV